jgi:4a-hydroxytetrahydrobiopterin dehydratase
MMSSLENKRCKPCEGGAAPLTADEAGAMLKSLSGWRLNGVKIERTYQFKNYFETIAFVNATAWISHRENHHPDMLVGYNKCEVTYTTHAINGLSENDFICAAKLDALFAL